MLDRWLDANECWKPIIFRLILMQLLIIGRIMVAGEDDVPPGMEVFLVKRVIFQNLISPGGITSSCYGTCARDPKAAFRPTLNSWCEGDLVRLTCPRSYVIITHHAEYGKLEPGKERTCRTDGVPMTTKCQNDSTVIVSRSCDNQPWCQIEVNKSPFLHECGGKYEYLDILFSCALAPKTTPSPTTVATTQPTQPTTTTTTTPVVVTRPPQIRTVSTKSPLSPPAAPSGREDPHEKRSFFWLLSAYSMLTEGQFMKANVTHMSLTIILSVFIGAVLGTCFILDHCRRRRRNDDLIIEEGHSDYAEDDKSEAEHYLLRDRSLQPTTSRENFCNGRHNNDASATRNGRAISLDPSDPLMAMETGFSPGEEGRRSDSASSSRVLLNDFPSPPEEFLIDVERENISRPTTEFTDNAVPTFVVTKSSSIDSLRINPSQGHVPLSDVKQASTHITATERGHHAVVFVNNKALTTTDKARQDSPDTMPRNDIPAKLVENPTQSFTKIEEISNSIEILKHGPSPVKRTFEKSRPNSNYGIIRSPLVTGIDAEAAYDSSNSSSDGEKRIRFELSSGAPSLVTNMDASSPLIRGKLRMMNTPNARRSCLRQNNSTMPQRGEDNNKKTNGHNQETAMNDNNNNNRTTSRPGQNQRPVAEWKATQQPVHHTIGPDLRHSGIVVQKTKNGECDCAKKSNQNVTRCLHQCDCHKADPVLTSLGEPYGSRRQKLKRNKTMPNMDSNSNNKRHIPVLRKSESMRADKPEPSRADVKNPPTKGKSLAPVIFGSSLPRRQNESVAQQIRMGTHSTSPTQRQGHVSLRSDIFSESIANKASSFSKQGVRTFPRDHKVKWLEDVLLPDERFNGEGSKHTSPLLSTLRRSNSTGSKSVAMNGRVSRSPTIEVKTATDFKTKLPPPVQPRSKFKLQLLDKNNVGGHVSAL